jgi:trehalose 6-phosphate synthase
MSEEERAIAAAGTLEESASGGTFRLRLVAHDPAAYRSFYDEIANSALWFVQHGLQALLGGENAHLRGAWRDGYVAVNERFAAAVAEELAQGPDAVVMFQDYHLYVAPALVRERCPAARLAQFVHIPWVGPQAWSALPPGIARAVHEGLLACDSVGFHAEPWRAAFVESSSALLGRGDEARAISHVNPVAVDAEALADVAAQEAVLERERLLLATRPERLILRVDRTDPAKNAVVGFAAFGRLLQRRRDLQGHVGMLALLDPSRQSIRAYADYRRALEAEAATVNTAYGTTGWSPIQLCIRDDFLSSVAAYKQYDVLLVNSVMDGLNLVAKEAPLVNTRDGVLVLSRSTGAWEELGEWAIGVDPDDVDATSLALEQALTLPQAERAARASRIRARVLAGDPSVWADTELAALDARSTMGR